MRYNDMAAATQSLTLEATELDGKKRLGKNQKARRAAIADELRHMTHSQPPATVRKPPTGGRADDARWDHRRSVSGPEQPLRSRIQRLTRKRRTGGVR